MSEPSVVAIDAKTKRVLAIGAEAKRMVGRTPANIIAVRPLRDGVISDFDVTEQMIKYFVDRVHDRVGHDRPAADAARHPVGRDRGREARRPRRGAQRRRPLGRASSRSRWPPRSAPACRSASRPGSLIVDIGGGTTEVAVISLGGIVVSRSIRIGGDEMDQDIVTFARREYNLFLGERTAEDIKIAIGSAYPGEWDAQRVDAPRPRPADRPAAQRRGRRRPDPRGHRAVRPADRRHGQGHDRGDPAGARRRHHGPGHRPRRRRRPAGRPRPARRRGDPDARPHRRRPADLRRARHRRRPPGARRDGRASSSSETYSRPPR